MSFNIFSFLISLVSGPSLNVVSDSPSWIWNWFGAVGDSIWQGICSLFYEACKWFLAFLDFLQYFIQKLIGLDYWLNNNVYTLKGATDNDLLFSFLYNESVQRVFTAMVAIFFVLLIVFTIFAIVKSEWKFITQGEKDNSKTKIMRSSLKAITLVLIFPMILVLGIISSNAILASLVKALGIDMSTTFGSSIFQIASQSAIKYREYANDEQRSAISNKVSFYMVRDTDGKIKYLKLTNGVEAHKDLVFEVPTYEMYMQVLNDSTYAAKEHVVNTMFEPVNPFNEKSFEGFCIQIPINENGDKRNYLVKKYDGMDPTSMYYYLKCVLGAQIYNADSEFSGGSNEIRQDLKDSFSNVPGVTAKDQKCYIKNLNLKEMARGDVIDAAYNSWHYSSIYTTKKAFEEAQTYTILYGGTGSYLQNTLGMVASNVKYMYNDDIISQYFDGGQFGLVQKQAEYLVMADVVEFIQKNDLTLYMMDATSPLIEWGYEDDEGRTYQIETKWAKTKTVHDKVELDSVKVYDGAGNDDTVVTPFIVSYSEDCNDTDFGDHLYLAEHNKSNELEGSLFIMCFKVELNGSDKYVPLVNGKTFIEPLSQTPYNFKSSYYSSNYRGIVIAKGAFDTSSTNRIIGEPTYLQSSCTLKNTSGDIIQVSETEPYYYDIVQVGGLTQYAYMGEKSEVGLSAAEIQALKNQTIIEKFEIGKFSTTYGEQNYHVVKTYDNDGIYYRLVDASNNVVADIADIQERDITFIDEMMRKVVLQICPYAGSSVNVVYKNKNTSKSTNDVGYYWFESVDGLGCYIVLDIQRNIMYMEGYNGERFGAYNWINRDNEMQAKYNISISMKDSFVNQAGGFDIATDGSSYYFTRDGKKLENVYSIYAYDPNKYEDLITDIASRFVFSANVVNPVSGDTETLDIVYSSFDSYNATTGLCKMNYKFEVNSVSYVNYLVEYDSKNNQAILYDNTGATPVRVLKSSIVLCSFNNETTAQWLYKTNYTMKSDGNAYKVAESNGEAVADLTQMFGPNYAAYTHFATLLDIFQDNLIIKYSTFNGDTFTAEQTAKISTPEIDHVGSSYRSGHVDVNGNNTYIFNVRSSDESKLMFIFDVFENQNKITLHSFAANSNPDVLVYSFIADETGTNHTIYQKFSYDKGLLTTYYKADVLNPAYTYDLNHSRYVTGSTTETNKYHVATANFTSHGDPSLNGMYCFYFQKEDHTGEKSVVKNLTSMKAVSQEFLLAFGSKTEVSIVNVGGNIITEDIGELKTHSAANYKITFNAPTLYCTVEFDYANNKFVFYQNNGARRVSSYITNTRTITDNTKDRFVLDYYITNVKIDKSKFPQYTITQAVNELNESLNRYNVIDTEGNVVESFSTGTAEALTISLYYKYDDNGVTKQRTESASYVGVRKDFNKNGVSYIYKTDSGYYFVVQEFKSDAATNLLPNYLAIRSININGDVGEVFDGSFAANADEKTKIKTYTKQYVLAYDYEYAYGSTTPVSNEQINTLAPQYLEYAYTDTINDGTKRAVYRTVSAEPLRTLNQYKIVYVFMDTTSKELCYLSDGKLSFHTPLAKANGGTFQSYFLRFDLYNYFTVYTTDDSKIHTVTPSSGGATMSTAETPKPDIEDTNFVFECKINVNKFEWISEENSYGLYDGSEYVATIYKHFGTTITDVALLDDLSVSILYNDNTYYNIKTQNTYANQAAVETKYTTVSNALVVGCTRDNFVTHFGRCDFNFWELSKIRLYPALCTYNVEEAQSTNFFKLSNGISFDYFFDGDIALSTFFIPGRISYWIILISSALIIKVLMTSIWGVIKRFYEITLYFIAMPAMASTIVLDDGKRFNTAIQQPLISKVLGTYGVILGINVFFILLAPVQSLSQVFTAEDIATSGSYFLIKLGFSHKVLNSYVYVLFVLVAFTMINELPRIINKILEVKPEDDMLSAGEKTKKNVGSSLKQAGDTITGKSVVDTVAGGGKNAIGSLAGGITALPFKAIGWGVNKLKGAKAGEERANQQIEEGSKGGGTESQKIDIEDEEGGVPPETGTPQDGQVPPEVTGPLATVENAIQTVTGVNPTTAATTGTAAEQAIVEAAEIEATGSATGEQNEAITASQYNRGVMENEEVMGSGGAVTTIANAVRNNATSGPAATVVASAINSNTNSLTPEQVMQLIENALSQLPQAEQAKYQDANGNFDRSKFGDLQVQAGTDASGNLQFNVVDKNNGDVIGAADSTISAQIGEVAVGALGDNEIVAAAQATGSESNITGIVAQNIAAGLDFSETATTGTQTALYADRVYEIAEGNGKMKADAMLRALEGIDAGGGKTGLEAFAEKYHFLGTDGKTPLTREEILADPAMLQSFIERVNKGETKELTTLDYSREMNQVVKEGVQDGSFVVTAWDLLDDDQRQQEVARNTAEREALANHTILERATGEEQQTILENTARSVVRDASGSVIGATIQAAAFAASVDENSFSPEAIKLLTGKENFAELTTAEKELLGFVKAKGVTSEQLGTMNPQELFSLKASFKNTDERVKAFENVDSASVQKAIETTGSETMLARIATVDSRLALTKSEQDALTGNETNEEIAKRVNTSYEHYNPRTAAESETERQMSIESVIQNSPGSIFHAFTNTQVEGKAGIVTDLLASYMGIDASVDPAAELAKIKGLDITKLIEAGHSEKDILMAYKTAELFGHNVSDPTAVNGLVAQYLSYSETEESQEELSTAILGAMAAGDAGKFNKVATELVTSYLTDDQKQTLAERAADTGFNGISETQQKKVLGTLALEDGEIRSQAEQEIRTQKETIERDKVLAGIKVTSAEMQTAAMQDAEFQKAFASHTGINFEYATQEQKEQFFKEYYSASNPEGQARREALEHSIREEKFKTDTVAQQTYATAIAGITVSDQEIKDYVASEDSGILHEKVMARATDMSYFELTERMKGKTGQQVYDAIHERTEKEKLIQSKLETEGAILTPEQLRSEVTSGANPDVTTAFVEAFSERHQIVGEVEAKQVKQNAIIAELERRAKTDKGLQAQLKSFKTGHITYADLIYELTKEDSVLADDLDNIGNDAVADLNKKRLAFGMGSKTAAFGAVIRDNSRIMKTARLQYEREHPGVQFDSLDEMTQNQYLMDNFMSSLSAQEVEEANISYVRSLGITGLTTADQARAFVQTHGANLDAELTTKLEGNRFKGKKPADYDTMIVSRLTDEQYTTIYAEMERDMDGDGQKVIESMKRAYITKQVESGNVTQMSAAPDFEHMTEEQRRNFDYNKNNLQIQITREGNEDIIANLYRNTTLLNEGDTIDEIAMQQTGAKSGLEARKALLLSDETTHHDLLRASVQTMAKNGGTGSGIEAIIKKLYEADNKGKSYDALDDAAKGEMIAHYLQDKRLSSDKSLNHAERTIIKELNNGTASVFDSLLTSRANALTNDEVKGMLSNDSIISYMNSEGHEGEREQLLNLGAQNLTLALERTDLREKQLDAVMTSTGMQNQVALQALQEQGYDENQIRALIKAMLTAQGDKNANDDEYITRNFTSLQTTLARELFVKGTDVGGTKFDDEQRRNAMSGAIDTLSKNPTFKETLDKKVTSHVSMAAHATDEEKRQFFTSSSSSTTETSHIIGIREKGRRMMDAYRAFVARNGGNTAAMASELLSVGGEKIKTAWEAHKARRAEKVERGGGFLHTTERAAQGLWFRITKQLPKQSAAYDNWNRLLERQISDIRSGKGAYATMSVAERKEKIAELESKKIYSTKLPAAFASMTAEQQAEFKKQQLLLKKEAFSIGNFNKLYSTTTVQPVKSPSILKKIGDNIGYSLGFRPLVSEEVKVRHQQDLAKIDADITRYNSGKAMRNKKLDFGTRFNSFARSYMNETQFRSMMKKYGLKTDDQFAQLSEAEQAAEIKKREDAFAEQLNNMRRVASKKVARDNNVDHRSFLEERGIETETVTYKDGSKRFTSLGSRLSPAYWARRAIVAGYEHTEGAGKTHSRLGTWAYNKVYGQHTSDYQLRAQNDLIRMRNALKEFQTFDPAAYAKEIGETYDGSGKSYAKLVRRKFGDEFYERYAKVHRGIGTKAKSLFTGHGLNLENSPVAVQQREIARQMEAVTRQHERRVQAPALPGAVIPAATDVGQKFVGQTMSGAKTATEIANDKRNAEELAKALRLFEAQRGLLDLNGLLAKLRPDLKVAFEEEMNKRKFKSKFDNGDDETRKQMLQEFLLGRLEKANTRVHNNNFFRTEASTLQSLNGVYVKKGEVNNTGRSATMANAINTTSPVYQTLVNNFNSAQSKYKAEEETLSRLLRAMAELKAGPQTAYTRTQIKNMATAINNSRIRLGNLKSLMDAAAERKVSYERQVATREIRESKVTNTNIAYNTGRSVHEDYSFSTVSGRKVSRDSVEGKQVEMISRDFVTGNKYMLHYMIRRVAKHDKELYDYITRVSRTLTDDLGQNIKTVKATIRQLSTRLAAVKRDAKTKDTWLETELMDNITRLKKLDTDLVERFKAMDIQVSSIERRKK